VNDQADLLPGTLDLLVLKTVLLEGMVLMVIGLGLGGLAAIGLGRFLSGLLFDVQPFDPLSMLWAALALAVAALVAALVPALRAVRIEPTEALREE